MDKHAQQLELAKAHFYAWRMPEAYALFRRFFDRLPFEFDPAHAQYMGIYVRLLAEMGKEREMAFYRTIVEGIYKKQPDPHVAYALVVLYLSGEPRRPELAKSLLDSCLANCACPDVAIKAKFLLAAYYDNEKGDIAASESIIESIAPPADVHLQRMLAIWKAKLLRDRGELAPAEKILLDLQASLSWEVDWYSLFSAKVVLGILWIQQERWKEAGGLLNDLRQKTSSQRLKCVARQLDFFAQKLENASRLGNCVLEQNRGQISFKYRSKSVKVKTDSSYGKLLLLFVRRKKVVKEQIIEAVYSRRYAGESDDALVYYQVHSLRKQLEKTGLPAEAIQTSSGSYFWRPEIKNLSESENEEQL